MLAKLLQRLPNEIKSYILSFTYQCQTKQLLHDIESFHHSKKQVYSNYLDWYVGSSFYQHFLVNDIYTMFNVEEKFSVYRRDKETIKYFVNYCLPIKALSSQFNLLWGLLTCEERIAFLPNFV
jgi:hypothetical protein